MTLGWNIVEGVIAVSAALAAGSIALLGFGVDSFVESASAGVMIWRLRGEERSRLQAIEPSTRAPTSSSASPFSRSGSTWRSTPRGHSGRANAPPLCGPHSCPPSRSSSWSGWRERNGESRRPGQPCDGGRRLPDHGVLVAVLVTCRARTERGAGWWWADPLAAIGIVYFLVAEGPEAWRGEQRAVTPADVPHPPDDVSLRNQDAEVDADRLHDKRGDIAPLQPLLDPAQRLRIERRCDLAAVWQQVPDALAVVGRADAQPGERIPVVAAFERQQCGRPVWIIAACSARSTASDPPVARKHVVSGRGASDARSRASPVHPAYE